MNPIRGSIGYGVSEDNIWSSRGNWKEWEKKMRWKELWKSHWVGRNHTWAKGVQSGEEDYFRAERAGRCEKSRREKRK